ncbi:MAG: sulfatase-like hydrolase/transferase [Planctomycetota bacterium]|nr:sulfatase-like hydrolase/transferase [Planctomycetota bacterium]
MASRDSSRPNIVVVLTDDQGFWAMGCAGNPEIRTPNLDRLARTGTRFENFFCVSPVCSPARASLLTGRIPSQHGIHDWLRAGNSTLEKEGAGQPIEYLRGQTGYTDILAAHGYVCGFSGKWHLGDAHRPQKSFTFWEAHAAGGGPYYGAPLIRNGEIYTEPRYVTDVITDNALRFLDLQASAPSPFYLSVHYTAPHSPWNREQHPPAIYESYYRDCPFRSTPNEPPHPWQINSAPIGGDPEKRRANLSGYFAAVTAADTNVGRLLDWLEAHALRQNTLIFFTGDNGMNMGHHGIWGKGNGTFPLNMYDTSVKVPALVSRPGHVPEGRACTALLSHYDVRPTFLDYVGLGDPEAGKLPGRSFAALLRGEPLGGDEQVIVYDEYGPVRMIRTREWKYVHRYPYGPHELYGLASDPDERKNLVDDAACAGRLAELRARLETWFSRFVDPAIDGAREPVTGKGQLGWAGLGAQGQVNYAGDWHYVAGTQSPQPCG